MTIFDSVLISIDPVPETKRLSILVIDSIKLITMEGAGNNDLLKALVVLWMASSTQEFLHNFEVLDQAVLYSQECFGTFLFVRVVPEDHLFGAFSPGFNIDVDLADLAA